VRSITSSRPRGRDWLPHVVVSLRVDDSNTGDLNGADRAACTSRDRTRRLPIGARFPRDERGLSRVRLARRTRLRHSRAADTTSRPPACVKVRRARIGFSLGPPEARRGIGDPSGPVAQLAEQQTLNLRVVGSIPTRLTICSSALSDGAE
jgi:hypothetical protein